MRTIITMVAAFLLSNVSYAKCTPDQFNQEYKTMMSVRETYLLEKNKQLDMILEKIQLKDSGMSDKKLYDYRLSLLQDESLLKFKNKEPVLTVLDILELKNTSKCGRLIKYQKQFIKQADKQWEIVFSIANKLLAETE
jgi:hypothetical protein